MPLPKSVIKLNKNGVQYVSSIDKTKYTIQELTRAAMRDVGKMLVRRFNEQAQKLPGMAKSPRVRARTSTFQYWARKKECDLHVGTKDEYWYGYKQELGTSGMKRLGIMYDTTFDHIKDIVTIESQYLEYLEDDAKALNAINEEEYQGGADE